MPGMFLSLKTSSIESSIESGMQVPTASKKSTIDVIEPMAATRQTHRPITCM